MTEKVKTTFLENRAMARSMFIEKWKPGITSDRVFAEIAAATGYSISYIRKLTYPIRELKSVKQFIVGEVIDALEKGYDDDELFNEYPLNYVYGKLANIDDESFITDPVLIIHIEKLLANVKNV